MKAILCSRYGTADELELRDLPEPQAGDGEVVVKVAAAALNFFDTLLIAGKYQIKPDFPFSPGGGICRHRACDRRGRDRLQAGRSRHELCRLWRRAGILRQKAARLVKVPDNLDLDRAAGLSVTYGTTIHALKDRAKLKAGETLAVLGAAGGTGLAAIEIGKLMGARVIACASSDEKCAFARKHGADETMNYGSSDLRAELKRMGGSNGIDVIYDPIGGSYAEPALRSMAWEGRYLVIGFAAGEIPKIPLNLVLLKGCDIVGVHWGAFVEREPEKEASEHERDRALVRGGQILRPCARGLSAQRDRAGAERHRRPQGHGQGDREAVGGAIPGVRRKSLHLSPPAGRGRSTKRSAGDRVRGKLPTLCSTKIPPHPARICRCSPPSPRTRGEGRATKQKPGPLSETGLAACHGAGITQVNPKGS